MQRNYLPQLLKFTYFKNTYAFGNTWGKHGHYEATAGLDTEGGKEDESVKWRDNKTDIIWNGFAYINLGSKLDFVFYRPNGRKGN